MLVFLSSGYLVIGAAMARSCVRTRRRPRVTFRTLTEGGVGYLGRVAIRADGPPSNASAAVNTERVASARASDQGAAPFALGILAPLGVVSTAASLWWISDRLAYIGPLDRAMFGWAVVIPVWISAPIVAGLVWRRLSLRRSTVTAAILAMCVGSAAATLLYGAETPIGCAFGAARPPSDWVAPSVLFGLVVGVGPAASGLLATELLRSGRPWRAAVSGAGVELLFVVAAIATAAAFLSGAGCQRPPL